MASPARAFAPRPLNNRSGGPQYRPQFQQQRNPIANIAAAQRDYARRTPGVLGASNGGFGLTPSAQWGAEFPNRRNLGTEGLPEGTAPLTDAEKATGVQAAPTNLKSEAVQRVLDAAVPKLPVTQGPNGTRSVAGQFGTGTATPGVGQPTAAETAAATTENGISRAPDWQTSITKAHPEIGVAGSEGNKAYIAAYGDALKNKGAGQFDPIQLAHDTMAPIYNQRTALGAMDDKGENEMADAANTAMTAEQTAKNGALIREGSPLAKAVGAVNDVKNLPDTINSAISNHVTGALTDFGLNPDHAKQVAQGVTGIANSINPLTPLYGAAALAKNALTPTAPADAPATLPNVNSTTTPAGTGKLIAAEQAAGKQPQAAAQQVAQDQAGSQNSQNMADQGSTGASDAASHAAQGYYNGFMHGSAPQYSPGEVQGPPAPASTPQGPQYGQPASGVAANTGTPSPRTDSNVDTE